MEFLVTVIHSSAMKLGYVLQLTSRGLFQIIFFFLSHCMSVVGLWPSSSMSIGCMVPLKGYWVICWHADSGGVGREWSARENSLGILCHGWELNPGHGKDRQWDSFIFPLSFCDWLQVICILHKIMDKNVRETCGAPDKWNLRGYWQVKPAGLLTSVV